MRKIALKGLIFLCAVLLLCFFFSGTIRTLTTAKVMIVTPQQGKLKEQITLTGYLMFSESESIRIPDVPDGVTFPIKKVNVARGSKVYAGDVLFEMEISNLNTVIAQHQAMYQDAQERLLALERQYANLRLSRTDQDWLNAYDGLLLAQTDSYEAHLTLDVLAQKGGVVLVDGRLPADITDEAILAAQSKADQADAALERAQSTMDKAARAGIAEDAYQYTMQRRDLEAEINQAYQSLVALCSLQEGGGLVTADHDGYVLDVLIAEGETWNGSTPAVTMSAENAECFLRADLPENTRSISVDTQVTLTGLDSAQLKTRISSVGYDTNGEPIIDASLKTSDIATLGTAYGLLNNGIRMTINYVASSSSVLIPVSAVRGYGTERYVYSVAENRNAFGQTIYIIERKAVTVLDETSEYVSVSSASNVGRIAYMEDRSMSEGSEVIPYD